MSAKATNYPAPEKPMDEDLAVIHHYVTSSIAAIDCIFGAGYARQHPELIRVYVEGKGRIVLGATLDEIRESVQAELHEISTSLDGLASYMPDTADM